MAKSRRHQYNKLRMRNLLMFTLILILSYIVKLLTSLDAFNSFANQTLKFFQLSEIHRPERDFCTPPTSPTPSSTTLPTPSSTPSPTTLPKPSSTTLPTTSSTSLPTLSSTTLPTSLPTLLSTTLPNPSSTTLMTTSSTTLPTPSSTTLPTTSSTSVPNSSSTTLPTTSSISVPNPSSTTLPTTSSTSLPILSSTTSSTSLPTPSSTTLPTTSSTSVPNSSSTTLPTTSPTSVPNSSSTTLPTTSSTSLPKPSSTSLLNPSFTPSFITSSTTSSATLPTNSSITTLKRIDWHDYALIDQERKRVGIGEQGQAPYLQSESDKDLQGTDFAEHGFNTVLSTKISLNRALPDIRHPTCQKKLYFESLPSVSVVIPFYNEHWSTLLRTLSSVLLRSPSTLIKEVLLVDDASEKDYLKRKLDDYLVKNMPKVRVIRLNKRSGVIKARLAGAKEATADVLLFLDSHIEVNVNWLPPLLEPIALNHRTVTCPETDRIMLDTFEYLPLDEGGRGAFNWNLYYRRLPLLPKDKANLPEPYETPVMMGGLFAIWRNFFWYLGGYDPGLEIWGGEQFELSFKIWQCGGRIVEVPCSHVGHISRNSTQLISQYIQFLAKNYRRVADVWMDEYAQFLYARNPELVYIDRGDISEQIDLREEIQCKSFRWYMTQIAFDLVGKFPPIEPNSFASGRVRPVSDPTMCIDANNGEQMDKLHIKPCSTPQGENKFDFAWRKNVRCINNKNRFQFAKRIMCWDLPESANKSPIILYECHTEGGNQEWKYLTDTKQIHHVIRGGCIEYSPADTEVFIFECDEAKEMQKWTIDYVDTEMMSVWSTIGASVMEPIPEESGPYFQ